MGMLHIICILLVVINIVTETEVPCLLPLASAHVDTVLLIQAPQWGAGGYAKSRLTRTQLRFST
jgi:hypothetical protein